MSQKPVANIVCIKWGNHHYKPYDVNRLFAMVKRNVHAHDVRFYCFTEQPEGLHPDIIIYPLPEMHLADPTVKAYNYLKEAGLCDDNLGDLNGQRALFFDLDVVITDELDSLITYPQGDDFVIINDWNTKGDTVGQATCYSWRVGTLGDIRTTFEQNAKAIRHKYGSAAQEFLSDEVAKRFGPLKFWPQTWCTSFKVHALPVWYKRPFVAAQLPKGTKVLAFHGRPKISDAINGTWGEDMPFYKRIYKTIRPAPWLADYWRE